MNETIKNIAAGWKRSRCGLPCEVAVRDCFPLPIPHSDRDSRWCVFLTFAPQHDLFLGEYDSRAQANRAAGQFRRTLHQAYDAA